MPHALLAALLLLQQQQPQQPSRPTRPNVVSATTPPSRDTAGYWQQRVRYVIEATLDEGRGAVRARATMTYVNNSPDTLRELYVHQYLNAFRPGSKWSAADEREGRVRFQRLRDPAYAYERFTTAPTVNGVAVTPEYPGAPDSTVVRLALPRPLAPGDSLVATFAWDARPSTLPRRQGRRGRSFDFAQWYPKVAVYDRAGWEARALVPAGEFYGEFGEYDVSLVVPEDQVIGATGVPVSGDPGWQRALRWGAVHTTTGAYDTTVAADDPAAAPTVPAGYKRVRFRARDVHHFAWSASPDYRYEGGAYVRPADAPAQRFPTWDTVAIHVLYRPGDERQWGAGQAVERTRRALRWLEHVYGRYGYPQMTNLHRIEGGGTEFPMMMMNGSASQGLILHEGGHIFTYGMLANNEWRSGWMDEGLTEYQTEWAEGETRPERAAGVVPLDSLVRGDNALASPGSPPGPAPRPHGYASRAARPPAAEQGALQQYRLDLVGRAEPIGTPGPEFNEFAIYNSMIYDRGAMMYGALRDAIGDDAFGAFLRGYYARWAFRHVDEAAMRAEAERASGRDLGWFFDEWVHHTGLVDYALRSTKIVPVGDSFVTRVRVERVGDYREPVPVGVRTEQGGWTIVRGDPLAETQTVEIRTAERPLEVQLDPRRTTEDWYRPNDFGEHFPDVTPYHAATAYVFDWPFLEQSQADRYLVAITPLATASQPNGLLFGLRARRNYQGLFDRNEAGLLFASRSPRLARGSIDVTRGDDPWRLAPVGGRVQWWATATNPRLLGRARPTVGLSAGVWNFDGILKADVRKSWDASRFLFSPGVRQSWTLSYTLTHSYSGLLPDPARWSGHDVSEVGAAFARRGAPRPGGGAVYGVDGSVGVGYVFGDVPGATTPDRHAYARSELAASRTWRSASGRDVSFLRAYAAYAEDAPIERQIFASAADPTTTFANHFWRPLGGPLAPSVRPNSSYCCAGAYRTLADGHYRPLGGAGLRGYDPRVALGAVAAVNAEQARLLRQVTALPGRPGVYGSVFADAGMPLVSGAVTSGDLLADAGVGLSLRGNLFDRDVRVRADFPLIVDASADDVGKRSSSVGNAAFAFRFAFSFNDLW